MIKISQIIIKILIIILIMQFILIPVSNASSWGEIFNAGDQFLEDGKQNSVNVISGRQVRNQVNIIYNILFALGVVLSVIIAAALGIKFMLGSVEEKAEIKKAILPYVAGCIVMFGAFGIWKLMINLISSI